ncbi:MAG: alpha/beta hydrolase [Alicyclobacillus sp.]|nr:alpha/beta hydrolase [Alicyclobacillus sp.]
MVKVEERHVTLSHGSTYYLEAGAGEPVILLHGVPIWAGGDCWMPNLPALAEHYHVFAPDFVGWGKGDRLPVEYSFAYLADFVREFQDALGISPAHVIGHSMGGWVASVLAYESPQRLRSLVLVGSGGVSTRTLATMTQFQPPTLAEIQRHMEQTVHSPWVDVQAWAKTAHERIQSPGVVEAYTRILAHMNNPVHRARYNTQRRLPHISCPVLVVWGDHDQVNDLSLGQRIHELIPHSEMVVLPGGHFLPSEAPDAFNQCVLDFLHRVSAT